MPVDPIMRSAGAASDRITLFDDQTASASGAASPAGSLETAACEELPDFTFAQVDKAAALASIEVMYQPIWNRQHKAISNYFATASAQTSFGERLWDDALRAEYAGALSSAEFDSFVTRRVLRDLGTFKSGGIRSLIGWPVHFETLAGRASRDAYIALCRGIPEAIRKLLVLELDGLPAGAPSSRLVDILGVLRPFCRYMIVRVAPEFRNFRIFDAMPVGGVGFSMSGQPASDRQRIALMNDFVENASRAGMRSYVHGLGNRAQVLAAVAAGFDWINGAAVNRAVDLPGPMMRFSIDDLYRDL